MLEEASGIPSTDRRERLSYSLYQSLFAPSSYPAQKPLDLGKRFFYRVEVRRVGRQIEQLAASLLDQLPHPLRLV